MRVYIRRIALFVLVIGLVIVAKPTFAASELSISKTADNLELSADSSDNIVRYTIKVKNTSRCDLGADIMMVFDRSGSMDDDKLNPPEPLTSAKTASSNFADSLAAQDQLGIVSYSDTATKDATLSTNKQNTKNAIAGYNAQGFTNIGDGVRLANEELESPRHNPAHPKYIILFTDGVANRPNANNAKPYALSQAAAAKANGTTVITIGLGKSADANLLQGMASPGQYYYAPSASEMVAIYQKISKAIRGVSPNTRISDDLSASLSVMNFVDADNGGKLNGNTLSWNLGDLVCGAEREVHFRMQLKCVDSSGTIPNSASVSNSTGSSAKSSSADVSYVSPKLTVAYTDGNQISRPGETLDYVATVNNIGSGPANGVQICLSIPANTTVLAASGSRIDNQICWNNQSFNPSESKNYTMKVRVNNDFAEGYSSISSNANVTNESCGAVSTTDITQIFVPPKPQPDYKTFATCVELSSDKQSYTAHFGFENKLANAQKLDVSVVTPAGSGNPVNEMSPGIVDRAFTATAKIDEVISWYTKADQTEKTATANSKFTPCNGDTIPDPTIDPVPTPNPGEVIGSPVVLSPTPKPASNKTPVVNIGGITNQCSTRRIRIANCSAIDDAAVETMQYSLDSGKSWHPVTNVKGLGDSKASCVIETKPLPDNTYDVIVRARDNSGEWGMSTAAKVDMNCEGIVIGANHPAVRGLSSLVTDGDGTLMLIENEKLDFTIEISGGPQKAKVVIVETKEEFELTYNRELNLWQGVIITSKIGNYQLRVIATEADGKSFERDINRIQILAQKKLTPESAEIAIYTREDNSKPWRNWAGTSFNQAATLPANKNNNMIFVTPGEYYVSTTQDGFLAANSNIVRVTQDTYLQISGDLLSSDNFFNRITNLWHEVQLEIADDTYLRANTSDLLGKVAPAIKLLTGKEELDNKVFDGKRTVLTVWNQWSPIGVEQMLKLSNTAKANVGINFMVVNSLINPDESENYLSRGQYNLNFYRTDNSYYETWRANTLPINYFIDESGVIKAVINGVMTEAQYREALNIFNPESND